MMEKSELKEVCRGTVKGIYRDVVAYDSNGFYMRYIGERISPLVRIIKEQQKEIEKLKGKNLTEQNCNRCYQCDGKGVGLDWGAMTFWECDVCDGTGEIED